MKVGILLTFALVITGNFAHSQQNEVSLNRSSVSDQKEFLARYYKCDELKNKRECRQISEAKTFDQLFAVTNNALAMSEEEEKVLRNRISTLECCLEVNGGNSCEGLHPSEIDKACRCKKSLKLNLKHPLNCSP